MTIPLRDHLFGNAEQLAQGRAAETKTQAEGDARDAELATDPFFSTDMTGSDLLGWIRPKPLLLGDGPFRTPTRRSQPWPGREESVGAKPRQRKNRRRGHRDSEGRVLPRLEMVGPIFLYDGYPISFSLRGNGRNGIAFAKPFKEGTFEPEEEPFTFHLFSISTWSKLRAGEICTRQAILHKHTRNWNGDVSFGQPIATSSLVEICDSWLPEEGLFLKDIEAMSEQADAAFYKEAS